MTHVLQELMIRLDSNLKPLSRLNLDEYPLSMQITHLHIIVTYYHAIQMTCKHSKVVATTISSDIQRLHSHKVMALFQHTTKKYALSI